MGTTHVVTMGDRGRLVVPAELRSRQRWHQGDALILIETDAGVVVTTRAKAKSLIREQLSEVNLVEELIAERRAAAKVENSR